MRTETCRWTDCLSRDESIEWRRVAQSTGFKISAWCTMCGRPAAPGNFAAKTSFTPAEIDAMPWLELEESKSACSVCSKQAHLESHHLAPRELFGDECELWPKVEVCRACHERFHERIGCPIGKRAAE
jgi:hypothetical protein